MPSARYEVSASATFEACHSLYAPDGADYYKTMHGHSFLVTATVAAAEPGPEGWVVDLEALERGLRAATARLDHSLLNEVEGLGPSTMENLARWIADRLGEDGLAVARIDIERPTLRQKVAYSPAG